MADTELSALVVKLEADLKGFRADMLAGQKAVADASAKMSDSVEKFSESSQGSFLDFGKVMQTALGVGLADLAQKAVGALVDLGKAMFDALVVKGVTAAIEAEAGLNKLNQALKNSGIYSKKTSADMEEFAAGLQKTTAFEDDAIISSMGLIQSLGQLDEKGLKQATTAALNMSTALGIDLNSAAMLVGKAATGGAGALGRYGVKVEEGATKAETFARALDAINSKFGGAAAGALDTFAGSTAQLENNWGNLTEEVGNAIVKNETIVAVIKEAAAIVNQWTAGLAGNKEGLKALISEGLIVAIKALDIAVFAMDEFYKVGKQAFEMLAAPARAFAATLVMIQQVVSGDLKGAMETYNQVVQDNTKAWEDAKKGSEVASQIGYALQRLEGAANAGMGAVAAGADRSTASLKGTSAATVELTDAQKKLGDEGAKLAKAAAETDPNVKYQAEVEALIAANEQKKITDAEYFEASMVAAASRAQSVVDQAAKEVTDLMTQNELLASLDADKNAARIAANEATIGKLLANELKGSTAALKIEEDKKKKEDALNKQRLDAAGQMFGNLAQIAQIAGKDAFEFAKAASIAETIIKGIQAVQLALAAAPPPFNFALAATQGALAAANVAKINSTTLAGGIDSVPGVGSADNFPAMLAPGERVVPAGTNKDLKGMMASNEQVPGLLAAIAARLDKLENTVIVTLDGRDIFNSMNDQLSRGRRLAAT